MKHDISLCKMKKRFLTPLCFVQNDNIGIAFKEERVRALTAPSPHFPQIILSFRPRMLGGGISI
jgi:hypothetical protein